MDNFGRLPLYEVPKKTQGTQFLQPYQKGYSTFFTPKQAIKIAIQYNCIAIFIVIDT